MGAQTTILNAIKTGAITTLQSYVTHIAMGDDNTPINVSDTALQSEVYREAVLSPITTISNTLSTSVFLDVTEGNGNTFREIGVFNASSSGTMVSRNLTTVKEKTSNKEFYYEIKYTINASNE